MHNKLELEEAVAILTKSLSPVSAEEVPLAQSCGRVLAEEVRAPYDHPPFPRAALDGYALRCADLSGARSDRAVKLRVIDHLRPGQPALLSVGKNEAVQVMAGAMLPSGCDAVVPLQDTDGGYDTVAVRRELWPYDNFIRQGAEYQAGAPLLPAGTRLNAAGVGLLASLGLEHAYVRRAPRVTVLVFGEELIQPGDALAPGQVFDANCAYFQARLSQLGVQASIVLLHSCDTDNLSDVLANSCSNCDLLFTVGSPISDVDTDIFGACSSLQTQVLFRQVKMTPGMQTSFSLLHGLPILSLPNEPYAAAVAFTLLGLPALAALLDCPSIVPKSITLPLASPYPRAASLRTFLRGVCLDGKVFLADDQSSTSFSVPALCDCLVDIPANSTPLNAGTPVRVFHLHG